MHVPLRLVILWPLKFLFYLDTSQDADGSAADDGTNQEAVYSQIKKFQVCEHKDIKENAD